MPTLLRGIIDDLLAQENDLVVVGSSGAGDDPLLRARDHGADMLITADGNGAGATCLEAILCGPPLSIFAIAPDGMDATAITLVRQTIAFDADEKSAFADAIRRVAGRA